MKCLKVLSSYAKLFIPNLRTPVGEHQQESLADRVFHHGHHEHKEEQKGDVKGEAVQKQGGKGESEMQEVKDYMKEDEREVREGDEYGGLIAFNGIPGSGCRPSFVDCVCPLAD